MLSFVVPVYRVQGYLRECLDSILDQGFDDLELIAVDDCSPDSSGAILAEYAAGDPRVRVISLPRNVGLGEARNLGLDAATGEYVWFVDSDDWLAGGSLPAVVRRLREVEPDVLIVDQQRVFWDGRVRGSGLDRAFHDAPTAFTARENPRVFNILHVAWNKIVRRAFLVELGLRFGPGWYEDVSYTYPVLVAARRISVLNRLCINYRQRRIGAITRTVGDRHFEVFPHWERTFEVLDEWSAAGSGGGARPAPDQVEAARPVVFGRMVWHLLTVLGNADRVRRGSRRAFFHRAADMCARHRPTGGYPVPGGAEGLKHRLLADDAWRTFSLLRTGLRVTTRARRIARGTARAGKAAARKVLGDGRRMAGRLYYRLHRLLPLDDRLAVYGAYWYRAYACNPAAVYEKAREVVPEVRGVWVIRRDRRGEIPPGVPYVVAGTMRSYRLLARAKWLVNNVNFPGFVVKRRGSVHLQTHHGTPLKVMGIEQARYPAGVLHDVHEILRRCDRWDFSVSANAFSTEVWERAYPAGYESLEVGYPRNDRLANAGPQDVATARAAVGAGPGDVVVLYAPTQRDHHPTYRPPFDADDFVDALGPNGRVLMRSHYFDEQARAVASVAASGAVSGGGRVRDVSAVGSVEDLYLAADILVTDYSSAIFDYAILDRPIVIYAPDWDAYRSARGVTFDLPAFPPGVVATTFGDLVETVRTRAYADAPATEARARFRARFCALDDGQAAERVVRRVFMGESLAGRPHPQVVKSYGCQDDGKSSQPTVVG